MRAVVIYGVAVAVGIAVVLTAAAPVYAGSGLTGALSATAIGAAVGVFFGAFAMSLYGE